MNGVNVGVYLIFFTERSQCKYIT